MGGCWNKIFAEDPPQSGRGKWYGSVVGAVRGCVRGGNGGL